MYELHICYCRLFWARADIYPCEDDAAVACFHVEGILLVKHREGQEEERGKQEKVCMPLGDLLLTAVVSLHPH